MKFTTGTFLVAAAALATAQLSEAQLRKEVRDMTAEEFARYARAINTLKESGIWEEFVDVHRQNFRSGIHNGPQFLPWHREYLRALEIQLNRVEPGVSIPYWDWTIDASAPSESEVFSEEYFGGFGTGPGGCIETGAFAEFQPCIRRDTTYRGTGFDAADVAEAYGNSFGNVGYESMRSGVESIHNTPHVRIGGRGGQMGSTESPYDPIFWSHHAFIDLLWYEWQQLDAGNAQAYVTGRETDRIINYPDVTVQDTFNFTPYQRRSLRSLMKEASETVSQVRYAPAIAGKRLLNGEDPAELRTTLARLPEQARKGVPRSCPSPLAIAKDEPFWMAGTDKAIAFSQSRVDVAGFASGHTCLDVAGVNTLARQYGIEPGLKAVSQETSNIIAAAAGASALVVGAAFVVAYKRRQHQNSMASPELEVVGQEVANPMFNAQYQTSMSEAYSTRNQVVGGATNMSSAQ